MVPGKYRLENVGRFLIESFERRRPALQAWTPAVEDQLRAEGEAELVQMERQCRELGIDDPEYWLKARGALQAVLLPRYAALAREEIALSKNDYGLWRGGDLIARAAFAIVGLVLGALAVEIPWIPVSEKWVPWALFIAGPFLPDVYFWWYRRRHQKKIDALVRDLARAGNSMESYRPLSELQRTLGDSMLNSRDLLEAPPARDEVSKSEDPTVQSSIKSESSIKGDQK